MATSKASPPPIASEKLGAYDFEMYEDKLPVEILKRGRMLLGLGVDRKERGGRVALELMAEACASADRMGVWLFLQAYPLYDSSDEVEWAVLNQHFERDRQRLINGYSQFGFVHSCGGYMYREPNSPTDWATKRIRP